MRAMRIPDRYVAAVVHSFQEELETFYADTYGTAAEAGRGEPELFMASRGGLVAVPDPTGRGGPLAMAGWTDIAKLGYAPHRLPGGDLTGTVELKRLFVRSSARGQGLAALVETTRIVEMFAAGVTRAVGETGSEQTASQRIHARPPYRTTAPFGDFADAEGSLFYEVTPTSWQEHLRQREEETG